MVDPYIDAVNPFLAGLSPSYWSHVPMLTTQLESLSIQNGLLCRSVTLNDQERRMIPVSKCVLCGIVVRAEIRSECAAYVVDDGTGLVDCLVWNDAGMDLFNLVPEGIDDRKPSRKVNDACRVGDLVRVLGRVIHCYSEPHQNGSTVSNDGSSPTSRDVREVHVQLIERASSCEAEISHWNDCDELTAAKRLRTASDVVLQLGPKLEAQVRDPTNLPTDDDNGEWRLFGARCSCRIPYKNELLCTCRLLCFVNLRQRIYLTNAP